MSITYVFVLIWLAYMICSGVWLFSRGFLLSRVSKSDTSSCRQLSLSPNDEYFITKELVDEIFKDVNASSNLCLPKKSKVIIILIDALKYEFGVYKANETEPLPYENKLPLLHKLLSHEPDNARLMRFKADPPTTTLQRLKGITTGSLPTFIDIGSNFATPEINEDNIIDQIVQSDMPVVFLGDDTWTKLYPKRFKRSYAYPSFDIYDLDSIDTNIKKHLPKELHRDDWQVLIAHFLGVDHCGHKHGPMHVEMSRKLNEMNEVIKNVIKQMDNETTLFVIGDHGMTTTGDHGGDTEDETNALLFAYSKNHKFIRQEFSTDIHMLQQIDLVPTLATILGVPIPYSNLGIVNLNIVPDVPLPHISQLQALLIHTWQNAQQIFKYFHNYAMENKRSFNADDMDKMRTEFVLLTHRVKTIYNEAAFQSFTNDLNKHLRNILTSCREIWIKFDATQISHGLLITSLPIFFTFLLVNNMRAMDFPRMFKPKLVSYAYLFNVAAGVFGYRYYNSFGFKTPAHGGIFFSNILSTLILVYLTLQHWAIIALNWSYMKRFSNMITRIILFIMMVTIFSNSYVINEPTISSHLLVCLILLFANDLIHKILRFDFKVKLRLSHMLRSTAFKLILACILAICCVRCAAPLFRCREELGNCGNFSDKEYNSKDTEANANTKTYLLAVIIIVVYTTLTRLYLRACGNLAGNAPNVILARYGPTVATICTGGHILLANSSLRNIQRTHVDTMALIIYALLVLQIIIVTVAPLMTLVLPPKNSNKIAINVSENIVPEIFKKIKRIYDGQRDGDSDGDGDFERRHEIPVVYGLATVYSSIIITFGTFLALMLCVLLEPMSTIGLVLCICVAAVILCTHAILRYKTALTFEYCIQPSFNLIVTWFALAHFCFFATTHQTTLSQIEWRAAFVGRTTGIGQSHLISGILVIFNTFCGQILFFSTYALLCTETFSIFALFPTLIRGNANQQLNAVESRNGQRTLIDISTASIGIDMTRGELALFENEKIFLGTTFKLAGQFFMLQGVKIFCAMLACTIHCRHLMVWKIFAPRFIYEALATFVTLPALIFGFIMVVRIHYAVGRLIKCINKIK